jgi:hypothetical protein
MIERRRAILEILAWGVVGRLIVLLVAWLLLLARGPHLPHVDPHAGGAFRLLGAWDGGWYQLIAARGYVLVPGEQSDPAFFPLLPMILYALDQLGVPLLVAGILVVNTAFLVGLVGLYQLGRQLLPEADARRAACYAAIFPVSFVFSMVYSESLALAGVVGAGLFAVRGSWLACAACIAAATLARPQGLLVLLPVAVLAARAWPGLAAWARARAACALLAGPAALACYVIYLWWKLADPFAWQHAESAWGRDFRFDGLPRAAYSIVVHPEHRTPLIVNAIFVALDVGALLLAWKARVPLAWLVFGVAAVLLPSFSGSFDSNARYALLALPVYWGLAHLGRRAWVDRSIRVVSLPLLAAGVVSLLYWFP